MVRKEWDKAEHRVGVEVLFGDVAGEVVAGLHRAEGEEVDFTGAIKVDATATLIRRFCVCFR